MESTLDAVDEGYEVNSIKEPLNKRGLRGSGGVPPAIKIPQDWGIQGDDQRFLKRLIEVPFT